MLGVARVPSQLVNAGLRARLGKSKVTARLGKSLQSEKLRVTAWL